MSVARECFIDANLLVLLVVGNTDRSLITKHKRTRGFSGEDYDLLIRFLDQINRIYVTPNALTEASNLIGQHREPELSRCFDTLAATIDGASEKYVKSATAARNKEFKRLGLSDVVLLEAISKERPLLTVDLDLYLAADKMGTGVVVNFTTIRKLNRQLFGRVLVPRE